MRLTIKTDADMSNIRQAMRNADAEIFAKAGQHINYAISRDGNVTVIELPQVAFTIRKGRLAGLKGKIKKKMLKKAIEMECRRQGYKAEIEVQ